MAKLFFARTVEKLVKTVKETDVIFCSDSITDQLTVCTSDI